MGRRTRALIVLGLSAMPVTAVQAQAVIMHELTSNAGHAAADWLGRVLGQAREPAEDRGAGALRGPARGATAAERLSRITPDQASVAVAVFNSIVAEDLSGALNTTLEQASAFEDWIKPLIDGMIDGYEPLTSTVPDDMKPLVEYAERATAKECQALLKDQIPDRPFKLITLPKPPNSVSDATYACIIMYDTGVVVGRIYLRRFPTLQKLGDVLLKPEKN